jgi:hypothetical protein
VCSIVAAGQMMRHHMDLMIARWPAGLAGFNAARELT